MYTTWFILTNIRHKLYTEAVQGEGVADFELKMCQKIIYEVEIVKIPVSLTYILLKIMH